MDCMKWIREVGTCNAGRRAALGALVLLTSLFLMSGCGQQREESPESSSSAGTTEAPAEAESDCVFVNDDFSNLQLTDPKVPVYDKYTISERRAKGLTTVMPDLAPYKEGKVVYLTFDDGPDDKNTPAILDILKENGVQATFYVTGQHAELHPDVLQRIYAEHHAIGNHSYDHDYKKLYVSPDAFLSEIERTDEIIHGIIGVRPLILRAPGGVIGHFTKAYDPALKASGYVSMTGTSARPMQRRTIRSRRTSSTTSTVRPTSRWQRMRPSSSCTAPRAMRRPSRHCQRSSASSRRRVIPSASSHR